MTASVSRVDTGGLSRREALIVYSLQTELIESLPDPGLTWRWSEVDLTYKTLKKLNYHGLIHATGEGHEYRTDERLWRRVREYAEADDDSDGEVGVRVG